VKSFIDSMPPSKRKQSFYFPRTTLVVEIERRCAFTGCAARNQIGLTKQEAIEYRGFDCFQCEQWNDDRLTHLEMPDSWETSS
jgi:hypothetical protein